MSSTVTRAASAAQKPNWSEVFLGAPRDLPDSFLPSYSDLVRCYFLRIEHNNKKPLISEMTHFVLSKWEKAGIPAICFEGAFLLIFRFFYAY